MLKIIDHKIELTKKNELSMNHIDKLKIFKQIKC